MEDASEAFMDEPMLFVPPVFCSNRPACTKLFLATFRSTPRELIEELAQHGWACERTGTKGKFTCADCIR